MAGLIERNRGTMTQEKSQEIPVQTISFSYPDNLVEILKNSKVTLVVSTYQSGMLLLIGQDRGTLDFRYRSFPRPMGLTAGNDQIWAGMGHGIWHFRNLSSAAAKVPSEKNEPDKNYTACYLPLGIHFTGDVDIHEMAFSDRLYFINTKFSCLCTMDGAVSFHPVWKPPFISDLSPVDKCHLNGLALREGRPRYVTLLGETDEPLGWRACKADGGMIIDIETNEILVRGLSMPHSPRWHGGTIWFLESGKGAICQYDPDTGKTREICRVPGFTRGLKIVGDLAFVGVSKVRESATFSGLPVTRLPSRVCGVWLVDLSTGKALTHIEFTAGVDEIFSVDVLPHAVTEISDFNSSLSQANYLVPETGLGTVKMPETPMEVATPHFERGNDLFNAGDKTGAIPHFQRALEIQPDFLPACFNMAVALGDLGRFDEAEAVLMQVVEKDASIVETYNSLGYVYYRKGALEKALAQFEKALALNPDYAQARTSLGIVRRELAQKTPTPGAGR